MRKKYLTVLDFTDRMKAQDVEASRIAAALGYFFFLIPMIFHADKQFACFHCNQSFLNFLLSTAGVGVLLLIPYAGPFLAFLLEMFCLIMAVRGAILALRGRARGIPLFGWITVIAYRYPEQA